MAMHAEPLSAAPRVLVWDLSIRVLHAVFAGGMIAALALGFGLEEEHPWFAAHVAAGLLAGGALALRLVLGVVGPRQARFAAWPLRPRDFVRWGQALWQRTPPDRLWAGHNPAASWVMLGIFGTAGALLLTGILDGDDVHEGLAVAMLALIGAHLAGLAVHTFHARENIALAMLDGRKRAPAPAALRSHGWLGGVLVAALLAGWAGWIWRGTDLARGTVSLPGWEFRSEAPEGASSKQHAHDRKDHDDD